MTKETYMALAAEKWESLQSLQKETDFMKYGQSFVEIWEGLGREVLEKSISEVPKDRRKKKKSKSATGASK